MIQIHPSDTVAVALHPVAKGSVFAGVIALEDIPRGHKMALQQIPAGEKGTIDATEGGEVVYKRQ